MALSVLPQIGGIKEKCGICCTPATSRGFLNCCSHIFCFSCIDTWSAFSNLCPICKLQFKFISFTADTEKEETSDACEEQDFTDEETAECWNGDNEEQGSLSFPSLFIDEDAVICLDGDGCCVRMGLTLDEENSVLVDTSVACDSCDCWYHAICVEFKPNSEMQGSWICPRCTGVGTKGTLNLPSNAQMYHNGNESLSIKGAITVVDAGETAVVVSMETPCDTNCNIDTNTSCLMDIRSPGKDIIPYAGKETQRDSPLFNMPTIAEDSMLASKDEVNEAGLSNIMVAHEDTPMDGIHVIANNITGCSKNSHLAIHGDSWLLPNTVAGDGNIPSTNRGQTPSVSVELLSIDHDGLDSDLMMSNSNAGDLASDPIPLVNDRVVEYETFGACNIGGGELVPESYSSVSMKEEAEALEYYGLAVPPASGIDFDIKPASCFIQSSNFRDINPVEEEVHDLNFSELCLPDITNMEEGTETSANVLKKLPSSTMELQLHSIPNIQKDITNDGNSIDVEHTLSAKQEYKTLEIAKENSLKCQSSSGNPDGQLSRSNRVKAKAKIGSSFSLGKELASPVKATSRAAVLTFRKVKTTIHEACKRNVQANETLACNSRTTRSETFKSEVKAFDELCELVQTPEATIQRSTTTSHATGKENPCKSEIGSCVRTRKIVHRKGGLDGETSLIAEKFLWHLKEVAGLDGSIKVGKVDVTNDNFLSAFKAAMINVQAAFRKHASVNENAANFHKGSKTKKDVARQNLIKKLYGGSGKRRAGWDRDWDVEFWKKRAIDEKKMKYQAQDAKTDLLMEMARLDKASCDSKEARKAEVDALRSRIYLADTSLLPRQMDIQPLSTQRSEQKASETGKRSAVCIDSGDKLGLKRMKQVTICRDVHESSVATSQLDASIVGANEDSRADKRKWALEVLARRTGQTCKMQKREGNSTGRGTSLLLELPTHMRPILEYNRRSKVPTAIRQVHLDRFVELYLQRAHLSSVEDNAVCREAIDQAVKKESEIYESANNRGVYSNLCVQALSVVLNEKTHETREVEPVLVGIRESIFTEDVDYKDEAVVQALKATGLISDSPSESPLRWEDNPRNEKTQERREDDLVMIDARESLFSDDVDYKNEAVVQALKTTGLISDSPPESPSRQGDSPRNKVQVDVCNPGATTSKSNSPIADRSYEENVPVQVTFGPSNEEMQEKEGEQERRKSLSTDYLDCESAAVIQALKPTGLISDSPPENPFRQGEDLRNNIKHDFCDQIATTFETVSPKTLQTDLGISIVHVTSPVMLQPRTDDDGKRAEPRMDMVHIVGAVANCRTYEEAMHDQPLLASNNLDCHTKEYQDMDNQKARPPRLEVEKEATGQDPGSSFAAEQNQWYVPVIAEKPMQDETTRFDMVFKQVEKYVKEHIRPLRRSHVISSEQYRWAVLKTTNKVMQHHPEAWSADFLIAEGGKVKRLAEQYLQLFQQKATHSHS